MIEANKATQEWMLKVGKVEARRQYMREWRRKNPEKQREYQDRYWSKKAREYVEAVCGETL